MLFVAFALVFSCEKSELADNAVADTGAVTEKSCFEAGVAEIYLSEELAEAVEADLASGGVVTRASSEGLSSLYSSLGIVSMERVFPYAGEYEPRTRREGLHRLYRVTFDPNVVATKAAADFSAVEGIENAEPVRKKKIASFDDPYFSRQWHYYNDGSINSSFRSGCDINVMPVWENYTTGSRNVIVAVVDEGIDYTHEDLAANYVGGYDFVYGSYNIVPGEHGTHTSGTIGAVNNNGVGVCGVAGGDYANGVQGVGLLSCQIFLGDYSGNTASAIKYGADNGAVICSNSWGYVYYSESDAADATIGYSDRMAVDYFIEYAGCDNDGNQLPDSPMKGGLVVFSAGNDAWEYGAPANYEPIVAVGAVAPDFSRAYYSSYGDWVDICAPGGDSRFSNGMVLSCAPEDQYAYMQGTSMSCPHVSGVAALVVSYCGGPGFTADDLEEKLIGGSNTTAVSQYLQIGGLVDALGAITYGTTIPPEKVSSYTAEGQANNINFTWNVTADSDDTKAYGYILLAATDKSLLEDIDFSSIPSGVSRTTVTTGDLKVGDEITGTVSRLSFTTGYYVAIAGYDYAGNYSELSEIKSVSTTENNPPVISTTYDGDYVLTAFEVLSIPFSVQEPDGHSFTVRFSAGSEADKWTSTNNYTYTLTLNAPSADEGTYTSTITATDYYDAVSTFNVTYTILEDAAPEVIQQMEDQRYTELGETRAFSLDEYISDPDGESLSWNVDYSNSLVAYVNIVGTSMNITSIGYGTSTVTVTGTDAKGKSASMTFNVRVSDGTDIDDGEAPTCYPNPVSGILHVSVPYDGEATFTLFTSSGSKVYEKTQTVTAYEEFDIDMSGFAPGRYTLQVSINGKKYTLSVTKI